MAIWYSIRNALWVLGTRVPHSPGDRENFLKERKFLTLKNAAPLGVENNELAQ